MSLLYTCKFFNELFSPYVYRHVNLRSIGKAVSFFETILARPFLASSCITLHLGVDFRRKTCERDRIRAEELSRYWTLLPKAFRVMNHLDTLIICFGITDYAFFSMWSKHTSNKPGLYSDTVRCVHLKQFQDEDYNPPSDNEGSDSDEDSDDEDEPGATPYSGGPWSCDSWPLFLASFSKFQSFRLTTHRYIFWPPTPENLRTLCKNWTSLLQPTSHLSDIRFMSGLGDEASAVALYWKRESQADFHNLEDELWMVDYVHHMSYSACFQRGMEGEAGLPVWGHNQHADNTSGPRRTIYFSFTEGNDQLGWLHLDPITEEPSLHDANDEQVEFLPTGGFIPEPLSDPHYPRPSEQLFGPPSAQCIAAHLQVLPPLLVYIASRRRTCPPIDFDFDGKKLDELEGAGVTEPYSSIDLLPFQSFPRIQQLDSLRMFAACIIILYLYAAAFYRASARELKRVDVKNRAYWLTVTNQRWLGIRLPRSATDIRRLVACCWHPIHGFTSSDRSEVENNMNSVERIVHYATAMEQEAPHKLPDAKPPTEWPARGHVQLKDIVLSYRRELPPVLKGISMTVEVGEKNRNCWKNRRWKEIYNDRYVNRFIDWSNSPVDRLPLMSRHLQSWSGRFKERACDYSSGSTSLNFALQSGSIRPP
ncbi:hypothetical protein FPV67DRAFT_1670492 [Lyophyllum atratum]|nr:hypothetical protein FPV67DRAFT_1670492 [Lyophyllum atratum]